MLAGVYYGSETILIEEREKPTIAPKEVLLRIRAASICGTDVRILKFGHFKIPPHTPRILCHEFAGEIVDVGREVKSLYPGMRITIAPNVGCGKCRMCRAGFNQLCPTYEAYGISWDGGFAEYMKIHAESIERGNVLELPENISYEEAALNEPLSCCFNGQERSRIYESETILVIGAGAIGIMHILLARLYHPKKYWLQI